MQEMWVTQPLSFYLYSTSTGCTHRRQLLSPGTSHCLLRSLGGIQWEQADVGSGAVPLLQSSNRDFTAVRSKAPFPVRLCSLNEGIRTDSGDAELSSPGAPPAGEKPNSTAH